MIMKSCKIKDLELNQLTLKRLHDQYKSHDNKIAFDDFHSFCKTLRIIPELTSSQELRQLCSKVTAHPSKLCLNFINFEQLLKLIASSVHNGGDRLRALLNTSPTFNGNVKPDESLRSKRPPIRSIKPKKSLKRATLMDTGPRSSSILYKNKSPKNSSTARISTSPYKVKPGYFSNCSTSLLNKRKSCSPSTPTKGQKENTQKINPHARTMSSGFFRKNSKPQNPSFAPAKSNLHEVLKKVQNVYSTFTYNHTKITSETPDLFKNSILRQNLNYKQYLTHIKKRRFSSRFVLKMIFNVWKSLKK